MKKLIGKLSANIKANSTMWGAALIFLGLLCASLLSTFYIINNFEDPVPDHVEVITVIDEDGNVIEVIVPVSRPEPEVFGRTGDMPSISSFITSVTAASTTGRMVDPDTVFILTTDTDIEIAELEKRLSLEAGSALDFNLTFEISKSAERVFMLSSRELLPEDSIVRLNLLDDYGEVERRWAFQTASVFKITSTLPAGDSEHVPLTTGIEISFSAAVCVTVMPDYFTMTEYGSAEAISGDFQRFRNTVVFIPNTTLKSDTLYTVTVKDSIPSLDGFVLQEGVIFSFRTSRSHNSASLIFYAGGMISETFIPGDPAVLQISASNELLDLDYDVKLYQFSGANAYRNALQSFIDNTPRPRLNHWHNDVWYWNDAARHRDFIFPTDSPELTEVYSSTDKLLRAESENSWTWNPSYLILPENLSNGWYLADVTGTHAGVTYRTQKFIQINPISVYATSLPNEAIFFINDTASGLAAQNASIMMNVSGNTTSARTDSSGLAHIDINSEDRGFGILTIEHGTSTYIDLFNCRPHRERTPEENYFMLLYTDREVYRTTDEIYVWGAVIPREAGIPLPSSVHLQAGTETEHSPIPITLNPDGTFTAKIYLQSHVETWWYQISLMTGDEIMCQKRIQIRDFVKPSYVFDVELPFYAWMPQHNPVTVSLNASFFEGTPAKNLDFSFWGGVGGSVSLVTDENGYAEASFLASDTTNSNRWDSRDTWRPQNIGVSFELTGIENEHQRKSGSIWGLFRDVMLESEYTHASNTLSVTTSMVDPTNFVPREQRNNMNYFGFNYNWSWFHNYYFYSWGDDIWFNSAELLRGEAADTAVTGILTRHWTEAISLGTHYDFIQKRNVERFRYENRSETVGTYRINTVNGVGEFTNLPTNIENSWYRMELQWRDTRGQSVSQTVGLHNNERFIPWGTDTTINNYTLIPDSRTFTEDQIINLQLENNSEPVTSIPRNARIFIAASGSEFITTEVHTSPSFSHRMINDYIPNIHLSGAYFDGRHIFPISVAQYRFDSSEREILIDISTDKDRYSPSERAAVTVTARDLQGRLVPNARVSFSAVDEAAFAVVDQNINTLRMVYAFIHAPRAEAYFSYIQHSLFGQSAGEKGGGDSGDTQVRRNFRDNAAFLTGTTDENGEARFYIDLPDNLTSWRLTVQVVGENADGRMCAGNLKQPLIVTIPLFLTVNSLPEYVYGDDITVSARVNGQSIQGNPTITATITGGNLTEPIAALAHSDEALSFGKLPLGMYTLLITASDGRNSDAVELPLEVVESLLETPVIRTFNLNEETLNVTPLRFPVSLTFYDPRAQSLQSQVLGYLFGSWGDRADFRLARAFAQLELGHIDEAGYREQLSAISSSGGLIRLLPHGSGDLELTALMCIAAPDVVNRGIVTRNFYEIISSDSGTTSRSGTRAFVTSAELTYAYLGLAALNEPVLAEIQSLLADPVGLTDDDKIRLCAALALLGDEQTALDYYIDLTESRFYEFIDDGVSRISIGSNRFSALALLTAGSLSLPEAEGIARHLMGAELVDQTFVLELMTFLRFYNPPIEHESVFTYNVNNRTETVTLRRSRWGRTLRFGKEQLENADFTVVSGDVSAKAFYTGTLAEKIEQEGEPALTVTKTYTLVGSREWVPGATVQVRITVNRPQSGTSHRWVSVNDIIPSGARFAGEDGRWVDRSLQRVSSSFCICSRCGNNSISYLIRLVNSGEFVAESAVARDNEGNWGMSERGVIVIE